MSFVTKKIQAQTVIQISEVANILINPLLVRQAGINTSLIGAWNEIVGTELADYCRPEKIAWPRRDDNNKRVDFDRKTGGGILTVSCEGSRALFLIYTQKQLIERINDFFGFYAVDKIRVIQKSMRSLSRRLCSSSRRRCSFLSPRQEDLKKLDEMLGNIENKTLREALMRLGCGIFKR